MCPTSLAPTVVFRAAIIRSVISVMDGYSLAKSVEKQDVLTRLGYVNADTESRRKRASEIRRLRFQPVGNASLSAFTTSPVTTRHGIQTIMVILRPQSELPRRRRYLPAAFVFSRPCNAEVGVQGRTPPPRGSQVTATRAGTGPGLAR